MGSIGANRNDGSAATTPTVDAQAYDKAEAAVKGITAGKRFQEFTVQHPDTGDNIRVSVEKVTTRDYWGTSTGQKTYTVYMWNTSQKNEYGNNERIYYNYGVESLRDVKSAIRSRLGLDERKRR